MDWEKYKNGCYKTVCSTLEDVIEVFNEVHNPLSKKLYRGHSDSETYKLISTIDRTIDELERTNPEKKYNRQKFANEHLYNFRLGIRGKVDSEKYFTSDEEAWTLGQHYSLKTPYLDWTYTPYVALFFCCCSKDKHENDGCVYVLDYHLVEEMNKIAGENQILRELVGNQPQSSLCCNVYEVMSNDNPRLIKQNGLFTQLPYGVPVDDWIATFVEFKDKKVLSKIVIESDLKGDILTFLDQANINNATIYPDLYGTCMYCNDLLDAMNSAIDMKLLIDKMESINEQ